MNFSSAIIHNRFRCQHLSIRSQFHCDAIQDQFKLEFKMTIKLCAKFKTRN